MAIFNRKKEVVDEVPELEHYYAERRTSHIWGWVMALVTMVATVLIILGLFYGGRWIYRQVNDSNPSAPTVTAPVNPPANISSEISGVTSLPSGETSNVSSGTSTTVNGGTSSVSSGSSTAGVVPSEGAVAVSGGSSTTTSQITNTGPGDVFAIALLAVAVGYMFKTYLVVRKI